MDLQISPDNRFVAAYTNNNQTILLNTLVSEFVIIDSPLEQHETVQGLCILDTNLVIYGQSTWVLFDMAGKQLEKKKIFRLFQHFTYKHCLSFSPLAVKYSLA